MAITTKILTTYRDGSKVVEAMGVEISINGVNGAVIRLSDWDKLYDLLNAGVLTRDEWRGNGMWGHDTYRLANP